MFVEYITVVPVEGIEQYVLSNPSVAVHLFVPPRGARQLCSVHGADYLNKCTNKERSLRTYCLIDIL